MLCVLQMEKSDVGKAQVSPKSLSDTDPLLTRYRSSSTSAVRHSPPISIGTSCLAHRLDISGDDGRSCEAKATRSDSLPLQRELICCGSMSGDYMGGARSGAVSPRGKGVLLRKDLNASITSELSDTSERLSRKDSSLSNSFESSEGELSAVQSFDAFDNSSESPKVIPKIIKHGLASNRPAARDLRLITSRITRVESDVSSPDV